MNSKNKIRIAVLQFACLDGKVSHNFQQASLLLNKIRKKVDLIVLPEMWPSGFRVIQGDELLVETKKVLNELSIYARKRGCYIVGSQLTKSKKGFCNTASIMDPKGKIIAQYDKVHLFKIGGESKKFVPGLKTVVAKTKLGKMGLAICYDIRFPEFIRKEVLQGAEILVIPSAWPKVRIEHYRTLLIARAIENQCFVISSNKVGKNAEGIEYGGHSVVIGPWGEVYGELKNKTGILEVEIDLGRVKEIRKKFPVLEARKPRVYLS